jgi:putative addiction module component (TIGR02574 family)
VATGEALDLGAGPSQMSAMSDVQARSVTAKMRRLLQKALELPPKARGDLAASLIDRLDDAADPGAEKAWAAEIDRRLDALDSGKAKTVPWSQVEKGLLKLRRGSSRRKFRGSSFPRRPCNGRHRPQVPKS